MASLFCWKTLSFISILVISNNVLESNSQCTSFSDFSKCVYERADESDVGQKIFLNETTRGRILKCFKDNDCEQPDLDRDPCLDLPQPIRSFVVNVRQEIGTAELKIERCLKAKFTRPTGECVAGVGFGQFLGTGTNGTSQVFGEANGFFFGGGGGGGENRAANGSSQNATSIAELKRRAAVAQVNIAKSIRLCKEKKGQDQTRVKSMLHCLSTITADLQRRVCTEANYCDGAGLAIDCKRQHRQYLRAVCQCRREKQAEVLNHLDSLRRNGAGGDTESVPVLDLVNALGNGRKAEEMCNDIRTCFTENNQAPPPTLALLDLFIAMQQQKDRSDKLGSYQMRVDRVALDVIRDLYDSGDFGDQDDPCKTCEF